MTTKRNVFAALIAALCLSACGIDDTVVFPHHDGGDGGASSSSSASSGSGGSGGSSSCESKTCEDLQFNCGVADNGCGFKMNCGFCGVWETCGGGGVIGVCDKTPCQAALENPANVPSLTGSNLSAYYAVLNCVCHKVETTAQCGSDTNSQNLCGMGGPNTGTITQDFFSNDPIGPCCAMQCAAEISICRGQI